MHATRTASFRPIARGGVVAVGFAICVLAITSHAASAATVIGSPTGNFACGAGMDSVQLSTTGATSYSVPAGGGMITSWSTQVGATTGLAALLVWRPSGTANTLTLVGESPEMNLTANSVNTFNLATPISTQAGDLLGLRVESQSYCMEDPGTVVGTVGFVKSSTPAVGSPETFTPDPLSLTLDVSATLGTVSAPTPTPSPSPTPTPSTSGGKSGHSNEGHEKTHKPDPPKHKKVAKSGDSDDNAGAHVAAKAEARDD